MKMQKRLENAKYQQSKLRTQPLRRFTPNLPDTGMAQPILRDKESKLNSGFYGLVLLHKFL